MPKVISSRKYVLDDKLKEITTVKNTDKDISKWLSTTILIMFSVSIIAMVFRENPAYLLSMTGYANGHHMFTHINKAIMLKDSIQNGSSNFWYSDASLGYPMFLNNPPLPCFITAFCMMMFEKFISPLCVFRWIIVLLVSAIPITWYKGARWMMLTRTQSLIFALFSLSIDSQLETGFELDAYLLHGFYPQLFAVLLLPLTVSKLYLHGMRIGHQGNSSPVYLLCLTYLCHSSLGFYCSVLGLSTFFVYSVTKEFSWEYVKSSLKRLLVVHMGIAMYLCWWIIPTIISVPYLYYTTEKYKTFSFTCLADLYSNGQLFDYRRRYMLLTCLTGFGFCVVMKSLYNLRKCSLVFLNHKQIFSIWLLVITLVSSMLFVGSSLQLVGLHFCGLLLASIATGAIVDLLEWMFTSSFYQKMFRFMFILLVATCVIKVSIQRVGERVSFLEVSENFKESLNLLKRDYPDGRILVHQKLGTGGSWDLTNIPHLTGKPGLVTLSDTGDDSLSGFYLETMIFDDVEVEKFTNLLNLYNIHYLAISSVYLHHNMIHLGNLKHISTVDDMQFFQVETDDYIYSYFDFVRIPGYIDGNLKTVRGPVIESLQLYSNDVLLYLNPRKSSSIRKSSKLNVQVLGIPFYEQATSSDNRVSLVNWKFNSEHIDSQDAIGSIQGLYAGKSISSQIIEEKRYSAEYHVIVHVKQDGSEDYANMENLLLKISYHPFWRCLYFSVDDSYTLNHYNETQLPRDRKSLTVHHVTPNLMAVSLPAGRYYVIFRYRFPGILKVLAAICSLLFINKFLTTELYLQIVMAYIWNNLVKYTLLLANTGVLGSISVYYGVFDIIIPYKVKRVFSFVSAPVLTLKQKCNDFNVQCVESIAQLNIVQKSIDTISKGKSAMKDMASSIYRKDNSQSVIENNCSEEQHGKSDRISESREQNCNASFSDIDSSFTNDDLFYKASPPTPPKHTKKSIRKKHVRMINSTSPQQDAPFEQFQTRPSTPPQKDSCSERTGENPSPVLGTILKALRSSSLSPTRDVKRRHSPHSPHRQHPQNSTDQTGSSRNVVRLEMDAGEHNRSNSPIRRETLIPGLVDHFNSLSDDRRSTLVPGNSTPPHDPNDRRSTLIPDTNTTPHGSQCSNAPMKLYSTDRSSAALVHDERLMGSIENGSSFDIFDHRKMTLVPNMDSDEFINDVHMIENIEGSSSQVNKTPIDISRLVIQNINEDEKSSLNASFESFSPEHSSSPELSRSSPEQFSSSPDYYSSPDSSFEYKSSNNNNNNNNIQESALKSDLHQTNIPISKKPQSPTSNSHNTVQFTMPSTVITPTQKSPGRRATIAAGNISKIPVKLPAATQDNLK